MPKKQLKITDCKGWKIKEKPKKKFVSLLDLPSFIHLNIDQVEKLKKHIYDQENEI
jgi:hypothetical protein